MKFLGVYRKHSDFFYIIMVVIIMNNSVIQQIFSEYPWFGNSVSYADRVATKTGKYLPSKDVTNKIFHFS